MASGSWERVRSDVSDAYEVKAGVEMREDKATTNGKGSSTDDMRSPVDLSNVISFTAKDAPASAYYPVLF
jgi:hypothetical protein